ncbi:MAG: hypothetical protein ACKOXF_12500 [Chitinophagaceae bacterium]
MRKNILFLFMFLSLSLSVIAQKTKAKSDEPDNKNIEKYLNDGRKGNSSNLVRLRLAPSLSGYYGASYERKLSNRIGIEGGLYGNFGSKGFWEKLRSLDDIEIGDKEDVFKVKSGLGISLYPKVYYHRNKYLNNGYFLGLRYTMNNFSAESEYYSSAVTTTKQIVKATYTSYALLTGTHTQIASNITLGTEWGFIVYFDKYKDVKYSMTDWNTGLPIVRTETLQTGNAIFFADLSLGFLF